MHAISDSISMYSYMLFDTKGLQDERGRLYNYEISLSNLRSPMIVLSACNSGSGTLHSGEGLMSLARSFILAGASSVVRTAWEVNDDSGSEIITSFYRHLSEGKNKDEALRMSKIEFMRESPPAYSHPYYWATYEVVGDNGPVTISKNRIVTFVTISIVIVAVLIYFRRRRILSERSL
jgi:CHAT domain-containing protein